MSTTVGRGSVGRGCGRACVVGQSPNDGCVEDEPLAQAVRADQFKQALQVFHCLCARTKCIKCVEASVNLPLKHVTKGTLGATTYHVIASIAACS